MASFTELWFRLVYTIRTDEEKEKIKLTEFAEGILVQYYIFFYLKITRCNNPKNYGWSRVKSDQNFTVWVGLELHLCVCF